MADESLTVLRDAFDAWRSRKRHAREAVPAELMARARRCSASRSGRGVSSDASATRPTHGCSH